MVILKITAILPIFCLLANVASSALADGITSLYTEPLARALPGLHPAPGAGALALECYATPGNPGAIGARQEMKIHAPLTTVQAILDDFAHYPDLFDGLVKAEVRERTPTRLVVDSEQEIPFPFIPNDRSEMSYAIDAASLPNRLTYLYQLRKSNHLKFNDGAIVLESSGPDTGYLEFDFWDADWGIAKTFAPGKVWRDNIEALAQADLAVKLRAEHGDWTFHRVFDESKKSIASTGVAACVEGRKPPPFALGSPAAGMNSNKGKWGRRS